MGQKDTYRSSSRDYLARARKKLDANNNEDLFYACLNLRCGIEARMREYLGPHPHISNKQKQEWNLSKLSAACQTYFATNRHIQKVKITSSFSEKEIIVYYVPVSQGLIKNGQKLGNYLHDMKTNESADSNWWVDFRRLLEATYEQLSFSCEGNLLGPMLVNPNSKGHSAIELIEERMDFLMELIQTNKPMHLNVSYHDMDKMVLP